MEDDGTPANAVAPLTKQLLAVGKEITDLENRPVDPLEEGVNVSGAADEPFDPKLSEIARHLSIPTGIETTGFGRVRTVAGRLGIRFDRWQDDLCRLMLANAPTENTPRRPAAWP